MMMENVCHCRRLTSRFVEILAFVGFCVDIGRAPFPGDRKRTGEGKRGGETKRKRLDDKETRHLCVRVLEKKRK